MHTRSQLSITVHHLDDATDGSLTTGTAAPSAAGSRTATHDRTRRPGRCRRLSCTNERMGPERARARRSDDRKGVRHAQLELVTRRRHRGIRRSVPTHSCTTGTGVHRTVPRNGEDERAGGMRDAQLELVNDGYRMPGGRRRPSGRTARVDGRRRRRRARRARYRGGDSAITIDPTCTPAPRAARRITPGPRHPEPRAASPGPAGPGSGDLPGVTRDRRAPSASEVAPTVASTCADRVLARDERALRSELRSHVM